MDSDRDLGVPNGSVTADTLYWTFRVDVWQH